MPDIDWNKGTWDGSYDWSKAGDEWSGPWGGSAALWFATIMPRIGFAMPARKVLEIAPGHGRCTNWLLRFTRSYRGIDLSEQCVAFCRQRFAAHPDAGFFVNDGRSLDAVVGQTFDLVFSYDSLVHADMDAMAPYIPQIIALLAPGGVAFLHHSNLAAMPGVEHGLRSTEVSAERVAELVEKSGGRVLIQEIWGGNPETNSDCFSMFCRSSDHTGFERRLLMNRQMGNEALAGRERFQHYLALRG